MAEKVDIVGLMKDVLERTKKIDENSAGDRAYLMSWEDIMHDCMRNGDANAVNRLREEGVKRCLYDCDTCARYQE